MLMINASNVVDEFRSRNITVCLLAPSGLVGKAKNSGLTLQVYYEYTWTAGLRKPITITCALFAIFVAAWVFSKVDTRISKAENLK